MMFIFLKVCVNYYKNTNQPYSVILLWTRECEISFSSSGSALSNDACYSNIYYETNLYQQYNYT